MIDTVTPRVIPNQQMITDASLLLYVHVYSCGFEEWIPTLFSHGFISQATSPHCARLQVGLLEHVLRDVMLQAWPAHVVRTGEQSDPNPNPRDRRMFSKCEPHQGMHNKKQLAWRPLLVGWRPLLLVARSY